MKTANFSHIQLMNPKLEMKYLRLEKSRNQLLDELEGLDNILLDTPPAEGKWSINQIIAHLILVEQLTMHYMHHKAETKSPLPSSPLQQSFRSVMLKAALQSGMKFKAPEAVADVPKTAIFSKLRHQWDEVRFKLEDVLTEIPDDMLDKCLFKHPYAGPLTVSQTLTFIQDHFQHHLRQINQQKQQLIK